MADDVANAKSVRQNDLKENSSGHPTVRAKFKTATDGTINAEWNRDESSAKKSTADENAKSRPSPRLSANADGIERKRSEIKRSSNKAYPCGRGNTLKAEETVPSINLVKQNDQHEGNKVESSTESLSKKDGDKRERKMRKGFEVYQVKRGKFSEKLGKVDSRLGGEMKSDQRHAKTEQRNKRDNNTSPRNHDKSDRNDGTKMTPMRNKKKSQYQNKTSKTVTKEVWDSEQDSVSNVSSDMDRSKDNLKTEIGNEKSSVIEKQTRMTYKFPKEDWDDLESEENTNSSSGVIGCHNVKENQSVKNKSDLHKHPEKSSSPDLDNSKPKLTQPDQYSGGHDADYNISSDLSKNTKKEEPLKSNNEEINNLKIQSKVVKDYGLKEKGRLSPVDKVEASKTIEISTDTQSGKRQKNQKFFEPINDSKTQSEGAGSNVKNTTYDHLDRKANYSPKEFISNDHSFIVDSNLFVRGQEKDHADATENVSGINQASNASQEMKSPCKDKEIEIKDKRKKVSFQNSVECDSLEKKDSVTHKVKNKTAGIIVLPSLDVLNQKEDKSSSKSSRNSELYHPNGRNVRNQNIGTKEKEKSSIRISSSGENIWRQIESEMKSLKKLLTADFNCLENIDETLELSTMLQDLFKELIVKHQDVSFKHDAEGALWKNTFHNLITKFRSYMSDDVMQSSDIFQFYWNFLQDGDDFLQDVLIAIQEEHCFDLNVFTKNALKIGGCKKQLKLAIRSCHLILLNLGDLERYITDLKQDNNYAKATEQYHKAQALAPKNGKPYNQMAVVAVKCKKKLDAVYYYIRSLEASNPIESARERLTGIFQDMKRKAEQTKKKSGTEKPFSFAEALKTEVKENENEDFKTDYSREDIWVFFRAGKYYKIKVGAHGKVQELTSPANDGDQDDCVEESTKVSLRELSRDFIIHYLHIHSKFYTRIGFEFIMTVYQDAMRPFKSLMVHERAYTMKIDSLIKYMAINIFAVNNLFMKQDRKLEVYHDGPIDTAIVFGMDMSGHIARHCAKLIDDQMVESKTILKQYLPAIRIWMKWMCGYLDLIKLSSVCNMKDIWENFALFFNGVRSMKSEKVEESPDGEPIGLFEDIFLAGFQPLIDMENPSMKVSQDMMEKAKIFMRTESLKDLTFMISDSNKLPVTFNEESSSFEVITPKILIDSPSKNDSSVVVKEDDKEIEDDESDVIIEDVEEESDEDSYQLRELVAKKKELTAILQEQEKRQNERAAIVESNSSHVHMISENHPKFIVPDTNCFIDNLDGVKRIIDCKDFTVVLPLIVVNELDGLKKGSIKSNKYSSESHALQVKERARLAVELLENRFGDRDSQLKALTSAGTELDTIAFRDEELSRDQGKNDDIILSCCLHYCEEAVSKYTSDEGPLIVQRKVVLLTDDRNLRLKAHSRHVPTISMSVFVKMAKLR